MKQGMGAILILVGVLMWHIASANIPVHNISDVWNDALKAMSGKST